MPGRLDRRRFLEGAAALAATGTLTATGEARQEEPRPENRIRLGIIGVAGQGQYNWSNMRQENIVALADVDENRAAPIRKEFPRARFYDDYRRLIENKDVQAVVISTPDHHHAFAGLAAMRAGKHIYCEKPLAHSVHEVRLMMEAARQNKVVTQMGTQIHAGDNYRRAVELIQAGAIGQVRRVHVWCSTQVQPGVRIPEAKVPAGFNYDLWLGPAPQRTYPPFRTGANNTSVHFHWRWWWDYGGGVLADMACHYMDLPHWALNLRQPTTVAAQGRITYKGDNEMPNLLQVDYEYPARGASPPVHLTWYHGVSGPDLDGKIRHEGFPSAVLFEGEDGKRLIADYNNHRLLPEERFRNFERPRHTIPRSVGHHREWLNAIRDGGATTCNFDYSGALTETVLLGNVAYRAGGGKLQYDAKTGRISNNDKAAAFLRREYRRGWTL